MKQALILISSKTDKHEGVVFDWQYHSNPEDSRMYPTIEVTLKDLESVWAVLHAQIARLRTLEAEVAKK